MNKHTLEMNHIKEENQKRMEEYKEKLRKDFENKFSNDTRIILEQKIQEAKDEFQRQQAIKEQELFDKKKNIRERYEQEVKNIKLNKIKKILENLELEEKQICSEEISKKNNNGTLLKDFITD